MASKRNNRDPGLLDVVALLADLQADGLARGQVGTVVELLAPDSVLVEFSDDDGKAYAVAACPTDKLLVLRYTRRAA
jgi:hypothetical protein